MHISLTPELENIVRKKVESGMYNNASEVIRESLRMMEMNADLIYESKLARLKEAIREGYESGTPHGTALDVLDELMKKNQAETI